MDKRSQFQQPTRSVSPDPEFMDRDDDRSEETEHPARPDVPDAPDAVPDAFEETEHPARPDVPDAPDAVPDALSEQRTDQASEDVHILVLEEEMEKEQKLNLKQLLVKISKRKKADYMQEIDNNFETEKQLLVKDNPKRFSQTGLETRISKAKRVVSATYKKLRSTKVSRGEAKQLEALQAQNLEKLGNLEWTLSNLGLLLEAEVYLRCHQSVVAAWVPTHGNWALVAICVHGSSRYLVTAVEEDFVKRFFTTHALEVGRYRSGFALVKKYDRRDTLEETMFAKARKLNEQQWEVMDKDGTVAVVDSSWTADPQNLSEFDKSTIQNIWKAGSVEFHPITPGSTISINQLPPPAGGGKGKLCMPPVLYRSKFGEHLCIAKSVASALAGIGYPDLARVFFFEVQKKIQESLSMFKVVDQALLQVGFRTERINLKGLKLSCQCGPMTDIVQRISNEFGKNCLVMAGLRGRRNNVNHCIVIANGKVVYDCNKSFAEALSVSCLETCCGGSGFHSFSFAKRFVVAGKWFAKKSEDRS